ncbi:MAG TPA: hypothetical protein PLQ34_10080, partial [Ferrovaceae bacterium]|nr:hypothetical protein [Ferrovaceae bacterium]
MWFITLLNERYNSLLSYSKFLRKEKLLTPNTVKSYLSDIVHSFEWLTLFAPDSIRQPMSQIAGIKKVAEKIRTTQAKINRLDKSDRTFEGQVYKGILPPGGLQDLQRAVLGVMDWARNIRRANIDAVAYRRFVSLLLAAIYAFSVNGRQSGVMDVKYAQREQLLKEAFCT